MRLIYFSLLLFLSFGCFSQTDDQIISSKLNDLLRFYKLSRTPSGVYYDALYFDTDVNNGFPASTAVSGVGLIALAIEAELAIASPSDYASLQSIENDVIETLKVYAGESSYKPAKAPNGFFEHFTDIVTGNLPTGYTSDISSIDTALLMYGALIASNKFAGNTEITRLVNKIYRSVNWTEAIKEDPSSATFPQKIYLKFDSSGNGDDTALTNAYNEYILVSYLAYQKDIIDNNPTGPSTLLWNNQFANPNNSPSITYNDPKDNGTTSYPTLTDNSGYIPNFTNIFARYLVNDVSLNGDYSFFLEQAAKADKAWFQSLEANPSAPNPGDNYNTTYTNNINISGNKYNNQVTTIVEDYEWGLGEGEQPSGVHFIDYLGDLETSKSFSPNEINENPAFMVSPAIIAGFIPLIPSAKSDYANIYRNKPIANYSFTGSQGNAFPTGGNSNSIDILWRYSLYPGDNFTYNGTNYTNNSQLNWRSDIAQGIDLAPELLGLGASVLDFNFFQNNNIFSINNTTLAVVINTVDDTATIDQNTPTIINVLDNDFDLPTNGSITITNPPTNGNTVITDPNNTPNDITDDVVTYTPNTGYIGSDSFEYEVCDVSNTCDTATAELTIIPVFGSIGHTVWYDTDGDAILDAGEPGLGAATVTLDPGTPGNPADDVIALTDANGYYLFTGLPQGNYTVNVDLSTLTTGIPVGKTIADLVQTYDNDGVGTANTSALTLGLGENNLDQDFGYAVGSGSVGGGGNTGGIESESLGDALTKLYVGRKKNSVPTEFVKSSENLYNKSKMKSVQAYQGKGQSLLDMFPVELVAGNVANVTSPTDILDITIADEVLSVDFSLNGLTKGVVLGIKTTDKVYNHTKASCDRLRGAEILNIQKIEMGDYNFLMQGIKQRNGVIEYAISFAVAKNNNDANQLVCK
tara:strand:- start:1583 stop:4342 length:2760 start_codon:yes stop_codon:yes gene_type:complete